MKEQENAGKIKAGKIFKSTEKHKIPRKCMEKCMSDEKHEINENDKFLWTFFGEIHGQLLPIPVNSFQSDVDLCQDNDDTTIC